LIFTSGSTGTPKGVLHSHRSLTAGVWGSVEGRSVRTADVYLFPFPMCHIAGYNVLVRHATQSTVVLSAHFRPEEFVEVVNRFQVASCSLAPTMLHALLPYVDDTGACMPTRGEIAYGSAAMPADLMDRAISRLAVDFHQGYGMTETAGNVTFLRPDDHRLGIISDSSVIRTAGRPHSAVEIALVDAGECGSVLVRPGRSSCAVPK
jgi:acyl-CoA synthetase (AMP-forming)/AMP-acid ligase II